MTTYYVGPGGSDTNNGQSWANRKLTLNGAEDIPVAAGDTVYVGPGVYRETLTVDVSGSAGSPITYIGDVTGEHTDGVGGVVRITGSDNDQASIRNNAIFATSKDYRTFRGFSFDTTSAQQFILNTSCSNWIIEYCEFNASKVSNAQLYLGGTGTNNTVRNCIFRPHQFHNLHIVHTATVDNAGHEISNCIFMGSNRGLQIERIGGITVKNSLFISCGGGGIRIQVALSAGQTITVNNNIFVGSSPALFGTVTGEITEDYNNFFANGTDRTNTATGANSNGYPPLFAQFLLLPGLMLPQPPLGLLSKWSPIARIAGTGEASIDLYGLNRPSTSSKKSWGAVQYTGAVRETGTKDGGSGASIKLPDAGEQFLMRVPVTNVSTTISIKVHREANYAGTNPQMIIRQPGQSDRTTTDTGNSGQFNTLSDTFTPAATPPYVDVFIVSNNTATSGSYAVYFDTLSVS